MMDVPQYSTLTETVADVLDPRHARGKRHPWGLIMTLIAAALVAGQRTGRAIGQWVGEHADDLRRELALPPQPLPSTSTLRRALRSLDVTDLETRLAQFTHELAATTPPPPHTRYQGQAVDGKAVRGAQTQGAKVHLVSLVQHGTGLVRKQVRVQEKSNEITAVPLLLQGLDLHGTVTTMDALLTQRTLAQHILDQHGHYLMVVKENQPALYAAIDLLFRVPPPPAATDHPDQVTTVEKGHGRLETRTLERSCAVNDVVDWPGVGQVLRRTCQRIRLKTGEVSEEVSYGITSLGWQEAGAAEIEALWRGHWGIENKVHYVRDVTLGEDAGQVHVGQAPHALAALRNGILNLLRSQGVASIADALRHYGASVHRTFELIGIPAGL